MIEKRREFVRVRMGYRTVRGNDLDSLYRRKEGTQYFLFITNIVMLLVGLANFCVCIWIRSADVHKLIVDPKNIILTMQCSLSDLTWTSGSGWRRSTGTLTGTPCRSLS